MDIALRFVKVTNAGLIPDGFVNAIAAPLAAASRPKFHVL
jgi:hypothetical protein